MTSSSQTNPNALRSVGRTHVSAWGLPGRSLSPVLPQTYTHRERMSPAGQWGTQITIAVQLRTALCGLIIHRVPCSARISVGEGAVSPQAVPLGSAVSAPVENSSLKIAQTRNRYHTGEKTLRMFVYTPILGGLRHGFAWICPPYLVGWILKDCPMVWVISPHFNSSIQKN